MADEPTMMICGMPVKVSDFLSPTMIGFVSADGKSGVFADMKTGESFPMIENRDGFLVPKGTPAEHYSVADHIRLASLRKPSIPNVTHDDMELFDKARSATAARMRDFFENQVFTTTTTEPETLDLAKMEKMMDDARRDRVTLDKKMIRALRAAGLDVKVVEVSSRPLAILPAEYGDALREIEQEDRAAEYERRQRMFKRCGFGGITHDV